MHSIIGVISRLRVLQIQQSVVLIVIAESTPPTILYNLLARTLLVTLLYLVEFQQIILAIILYKLCVVCASIPRVIIKLSYKVRSLLLAKDLSVKTNSFVQLSLRGTQDRPLQAFQIYYQIRAFRALKSSLLRSIVQVVTLRLKVASSQQTKETYAPLARCVTYCYAALLFSY